MKAILTSASCLKCLEVIKTSWCDSLVWRARLFINDYTPNCGTVLSDLTEAHNVGDFVLTGSYSAPAVTGACRASMGIALIELILADNVPQTAYGWFAVDGASRLVWAQRFLSPIPLTVTGDKVVITGHEFRVRGS